MNVKHFKITSLAFLCGLLSLGLTACGGSDSGSGNPDTGTDTGYTSSTKVTITNLPDSVTSFDSNTLDANNFMTFSVDTGVVNESKLDLANAAKFGTLVKLNRDSQNETQNIVTYLYQVDKLDELANADIPFEEEITLPNLDGTEEKFKFALISGDPYLKHQWHIHNTGDDFYYYTTTNPVRGVDHNIAEAWFTKKSDNKYLSGKGISVLVIDNPIDFKHVDFINQKLDISNKNLPKELLKHINNDVTMDFALSESTSAHGSVVAGLIGAEANSKGVRGIAYNAKLINYNMPNTADTGAESSYNLPDYLDIDVVNASYGFYTYTSQDVLSEDLLYHAINDKGGLIVKAIGNYAGTSLDQFIDITHISSPIYSDEFECLLYDVDCFASQFDNLERAPNSIVVGSLNHEGTKASYSSTGSSIWISAIGSEGNDFLPQITSDLYRFTCDDYEEQPVYARYLFYTYWGGRGLFNLHQDPNDVSDCSYTSLMAGTSAATPVVSGVVGLLKEINRDFTPEQIKYFLAKSANFIEDPKTAEVYEFNDHEVLTGNHWVETDNFKFNNMYGFGMLDAKKAVDLALANDEDGDNNYNLRKNPPVEDEADDVSCIENYRSNKRVTYECTFSNFPTLAATSHIKYQIEYIGINLNSLYFTSEDADKYESYCNYDTVSSSSEAVESFYKKFSYYSVALKDPKGQRAVIKPYFATYEPANSYFGGGGSDEDPVYAKVNTFYLNDYIQGDKWTLEIDSQCKLDVDMLEKNLKPYFYVYGKQ